MKLKYCKIRGSNTLIFLLEIEEYIIYYSYDIKSLIKKYKRNVIKYRLNLIDQLDLIYEKEYNSFKELEFDYLEELI